MLRIEIRKSFHNKFFYSAMGIAIGIAVISAVQSIHLHQVFMQLEEKFHPEVYAYNGASLYNSWLGAEGGFSTHLFYFLIFLLCTIPYSWSLSTEKKSGYINQNITRTRRSEYYIAKYASAFLAGGSVAVIPMFTNLLICALFIPAYPMDQLNDLFIGVPQQFMWSSVLYKAPLLYVMLYIILSFIFTGLWATIGISLAFWVKNKLGILVAPFLFIIFVQVLSNYSTWNGGNTIIPTYLIAPRAYGYGYTSWIAIISWFSFILLFHVITFLVRGRNKDVI